VLAHHSLRRGFHEFRAFFLRKFRLSRKIRDTARKISVD